ncbi:MAG: glyoxalase superfamily protein [Kofleriaceae bacterium]
MGPVTPILRSFDEAKAREFYIDWLGFAVVFEHRFEPTLPLYMGIKRGDCVLHLSEHHGDGSPGAHVRILCPDLEAFHAEISAKNYKNGRPGLVDQDWGAREMMVHDPVGNVLVFYRDL